MKQTSELLFDLFVNRQDVYAEAFLQKDGKKMGYAKKLSPITPNLIDRHILGNKTLGVYQLNGNNVKWACLDFDENTEKDFENAKTLYFVLEK